METERLSRAERRRSMREAGRTSKWLKKLSPKELHQGNGWFGEMDKVWVNDKYCVMARTIQTEWGTVHHACIRNVSGGDIPWREKQKIKNELWGKEYTAIEVFPKESELVDAANMYHLWIFKDYKLSFGLKGMS
jgi:hypothetical protein